MANPPGGPLSGGMEAQQNFALRTIRENQAAQQQQQPAQREQPQPTNDNRQADAEAARQKALEQNERVAEQRAQEQKARIQELAAKFAPNPQRDEQPQLQRQQQHER